jgi:hypothetical protein
MTPLVCWSILNQFHNLNLWWHSQNMQVPTQLEDAYDIEARGARCEYAFPQHPYVDP